jgi:mono/diheme cytochrome c family protein
MKLIAVAYFAILTSVSVFLYQDKSLEESRQAGKEIYADFCVTCHLENGEGVPNVFPPLAQSDYLVQNREGSIRGVKYGQSGEIVVNGLTYNSVMADPGLTEEEVADVMNYILSSWGNSSPEQVTIAEVEGVQPPE